MVVQAPLVRTESNDDAALRNAYDLQITIVCGVLFISGGTTFSASSLTVSSTSSSSSAFALIPATVLILPTECVTVQAHRATELLHQVQLRPPLIDDEVFVVGVEAKRPLCEGPVRIVDRDERSQRRRFCIYLLTCF